MATGRQLVSDVRSKGKYYLYRYVRADKNLVFYVGIGTKANRKTEFRTHKAEYHRAYYNHHSEILKKITDKTQFDIDIILESDDYNFIKTKEIEFIALYGRINLKTGTLVNLTAGGDGLTGFKISEETRRKMSLNTYSKGKFGAKHPGAKALYQYDITGNFIKKWGSLAEVGRFFGVKTPSFYGKTFKGFQWFYEFRGERTFSVVNKKRISKLKTI